MRPLQALVGGLHDAVVLLELDGSIWALSRGGRELLGVEAGARGPLPALVADPTALASLLGLWSTSDAPVPGTLTPSATGVALRADGRRLPGSDPALLVVRLERRDEAARDFSALRSSLAELQEEMRHRRTLELRNQRLLEEQRAATERAEQLNRVKDEFLGAVSHELRTPLNAIAGWAQLLARPSGAAMLERGVVVIQRNCELQRRLIDDLVDLSRLASGEVRLVLERVRLMEVVQSAVDRLLDEARESGLEVVVEAPGDGPPTLVADAARLEQVVWNLVSNAIKYTPDGGRVRVSVHVHPSWVELRVADTGRGMDAEGATKAFDSFWKGSHRMEGLGMGLALVQQLVELHGGEVSAHSDGPGLGSTFTVRLPDEAAAVASPTPAARASRSRGPRLIGARVLLVEDHEDSRELLSHVLSAEGAEVTACSTAAEAITILGRSPFDLIVSDLRLVSEGVESIEMDGCVMLRQIRSTRGMNQRVPAIALTAYGAEVDRQRTADAGFQLHVLKPVDAAAFVTGAERLVSQDEAT